MKNKIIYILLLVILFVFILNSYSLAVAGDLEFVSIDSSILNNVNNYVINNYNSEGLDHYYYFFGPAEYYGTLVYRLYLLPKNESILNNKLYDDGNRGNDSLGSYYDLRFQSAITSGVPVIFFDLNNTLEPINTINYSYLEYFRFWKDSDLNCFLATNLVIYKDNTFNSTYNSFDTFVNPYIANTAEDLATGTFDFVQIFPGDLTSDDNLGVKIAEVIPNTYTDLDGIEHTGEVFNWVYKQQLDNSFINGFMTDFWYEIYRDKMGINFKEGIRYIIQLVNDVNKIIYDEDYICYDEIYFTIGGLTEQDKEDNRVNSIISSNKDTTNAIKEQTEVSKNIFQKIGDILSFINPFSENFFGRKLVELILDGLKSLFVPSDDFFTNWFDDMNSWLGDRFGILYFPTEIVLDFLNRVGGLSSSSSCSLTIPQLKLNFFGNEVVVFNGYTYDFNELLVNDTFKNIHTIYLTVVDVILYLCLIVLAHNAFSTVFGGHYIDDAVHDTYDYVEFKQANSKKIKPGFNTGGRR